MHIAIDARVINSGTGTYVVKLLEYLQKIDTANQYSVLVPSKDIKYWKPTSVNFKIVPADYANYSFSEQVGFKKFLDKLKPDLVHFCMPQQPILYKGKSVTTVHDLILLQVYNSDKNWLIFHFKQMVGRWVFKRIAKTNNHIIAVSKNTKNEYQKYTNIADNKISVIYEAAETPTTKLKEYKVPFDKFIMYVGQQPDYKNIKSLAKAHQELLKTKPNLGLVLVGRLNKDTLQNKHFFEKLGYKNIHFTGYISDSERDFLFTKAVAYVFPSLIEGFGLPPLEAMAYGTPVISSNTSCMPEVLGNAAEYFNPYNTDDIVKAINKVIDDTKLQKSLVASGKKQVSKYSWQKMAQQTLDIYLKVLKP